VPLCDLEEDKLRLLAVPGTFLSHERLSAIRERQQLQSQLEAKATDPPASSGSAGDDDVETAAELLQLRATLPPFLRQFALSYDCKPFPDFL
jgi:hypothetical protein